MITHCHNAHRRFAPRDPGPAGVALVRHEVAVGLICDLVHLSAETVLGVFAAAGDRVVVVTDAVAPAGSDATTWRFDDEVVTIADGRATMADGTLAGSVVTPDGSLRALVSIGVSTGGRVGRDVHRSGSRARSGCARPDARLRRRRRGVGRRMAGPARRSSPARRSARPLSLIWPVS